jgi:hypothetical protein
MGKACSTLGIEDECIKYFGVKDRNKETTGKTKTYGGG